MNFKRLLILVIALLFQSHLFSQDLSHPIVPFSTGRSTYDSTFYENESGKIRVSNTTKDWKTNNEVIDFTESKRVIVEFKDEPIFLVMKKGKLSKINSASYTATFQSFRMDLRNKSNSWEVYLRSSDSYSSKGKNNYLKWDSTKIYAKKYGTNEWYKINFTIKPSNAPGYVFVAALSKFTNYDSAAVDLRISVEDLMGNSTEFTFLPAFAVGKFEGKQSPDAEPPFFIPSSYKLHQNFPNPFNPETIISFDLPEKAKVSLKIFDILGREVRTLVNEEYDKGLFKVNWNGKNNMGEKLASGIYIYQIRVNNFVEAKKMILIK